MTLIEFLKPVPVVLAYFVMGALAIGCGIRQVKIEDYWFNGFAFMAAIVAAMCIAKLMFW